MHVLTEGENFVGEELNYAPPVKRPDRPEYAAKREELRAAGVKYVFSAYTDLHGVGKGKMVPIDHFVDMMRGSELFTGAAIDGLGQTPADDEIGPWPDLDRIMIMPHRPEVAVAFGALHYGGEPWPMCSRNVLQRAIDRAEQMGFTFNLGIETEFYLVKKVSDTEIVPHDPLDVMEKAAYDIVETMGSHAFLDEAVTHMNTLGFDVASFDHEDSNGQFEIDFAYADVMTSCDRQVMWRMMMKELARKHGFDITMMPKPYSNRTGTGAHFNMSLADIKSGENLFATEDDPRGCELSNLGYQFIAGILAHAPALTAMACSTVNSYKRLLSTGSMTGFTWAPVFISYGRNNRTHMVRIPMTSPRVESRAVDPTCNPHVTAAMYLHAGLDGIEQGMDPGDPINLNMYTEPASTRERLGVKTLPRTLLEAVEAFAEDELCERALGPDLRQSFIDLKSQEWWEYHNHVSDWELKRYLTFF